MTYLTAPEAHSTNQRTYRYFVELASDELDFEGVPERFKIVDVVVTEPTEAAIKTLVAATHWLKGYTMVSHWIPDDCDCF